MKVLSLLVGLACVCTTTAACAAEEWITIPNSDPNITFSFDKASIARRGNLVRVWEKMVYTQPQIKDEASGKMIKEKKVHRLMNCDDYTQGVIYGATYTENGRFISSVSYDEPQAQMSAVPFGTLAAEELRIVCILADR
jgi:hypothetical protein